MKMPLFQKIIDEAATIPHINHITLTGLGETLLDPLLVQRVEYVRKQCAPGLFFDIYTNGSFLTHEKSEALLDAGLSVIYVSLNGINSYQRREIMKVDDFDRVERYTRHAIDYAHKLGRGQRVIVKTIVSKDLMEPGDAEDFSNKWGGAHDKGGHAYLHLEGNWAGAMWPMRVKPQQACGRALQEIMVLWDGRVSLCCFDGEGEVIFGDLNTQTIRQIYNDENGKAFMYRTAHVEGKRGELPLCATCTAI